MVTSARATRTGAQHNRLRRRVRSLTDEVVQLQAATNGNNPMPAPNLKVLSHPNQNASDFDVLLDRVLDVSKSWEKITALVALITTNLSGNKSLGALLDIMAKDKLKETGNGNQVPSLGNINIGELLSMAEGLLKTGQLPTNPVPPAPASEEIEAEVPEAATVEAEIVEPPPEPVELTEETEDTEVEAETTEPVA